MQQAAHTTLSYKDLLEESIFVSKQLKEITEDKKHLEDIVRLLKRQRFAPKSEVQNTAQGTLFNEAEAIAADETSLDDEASEESSQDPAVKPNAKK